MGTWGLVLCQACTSPRTLDGSPGHRISGVPLESGKWGAIKCDSYESAF